MMTPLTCSLMATIRHEIEAVLHEEIQRRVELEEAVALLRESTRAAAAAGIGAGAATTQLDAGDVDLNHRPDSGGKRSPPRTTKS